MWACGCGRLMNGGAGIGSRRMRMALGIRSHCKGELPRTTVSPPRSPGWRKRGWSTQPRPKDGGLRGLLGAALKPIALATAAAAAIDDAGLIPRAPSGNPSPHSSTIRRTKRWKEKAVANAPRSRVPRYPSTTASRSTVQSARLKRGPGGRNGGGAGCAGAVAIVWLPLMVRRRLLLTEEARLHASARDWQDCNSRASTAALTVCLS